MADADNSRIPLLKWILDHQVRQFDHYLQTMTAFIDGEKQKLSDQFDRANEGQLPEVRHDAVEWYQVDYDILDELFPSYLYRGALISFWSFFENEMLLLCHQDLRRLEWEKGVVAMVETEAEKAIDSLEKVVSYWKKNYSLKCFDGPSWSKIKRYQQVRNVIVHKEGHLGSDNRSRAVKQFVASRENAEVKGLWITGDVLMVGKEFCMEVREECAKFLDEFYLLIPHP